MQPRLTRLIPVYALMLLCMTACNGDSSSGSIGVISSGSNAETSSVPAPVVEGPVSGGVRGRPWGRALASQSPLDEYDYVEEEYFYSGVAQKRGLDGALVGGEAAYTTRMLVDRPANPEDFNGTVILEWLNVSMEMDLPLMWILGHEEIMGSGFIYVGISAQAVGVSDSPTSLKSWDPVRYAPLSHPGDAYAHDIFAQAAKALFNKTGPLPLPGIKPDKIIAMGESQSCSYLTQYANVVQAEHMAMDAFLLHSCSGYVSDDIGVPTMLFLTESEIDGFTAPGDGAGPTPEQVAEIPGLGIFRLFMLNNGLPPQDDGDLYRVWEIAGGSHFDKQAMAYLVPFWEDNLGAPSDQGFSSDYEWSQACMTLPNQLGMERPTRAAIRQIHEWVAEGKSPASYPRVEKNEDGSITRDAEGLAIGGIRMPPVVAPDGINVGDDCPFIGSYTPSEASAMQSKYASKQAFLDAVTQATFSSIDEGTLLEEDFSLYLDEATEIDAW